MRVWFFFFVEEMKSASVEDQDFFNNEIILSTDAPELCSAILVVDPAVLKALKDR